MIFWGNTTNLSKIFRQVYKFLWCLLGLFIGFGLITLLVWQLNLQTTRQRTKSDDYFIERIVNNTSEVANGALAIPDENIVLNVKSKTGKVVSADNIKWWYDTSAINFNNINLETTNENTLRLEVVSESTIISTSEITVLAIITEENGNEVTTSIDIPVGAFITNPVPKDMFVFDDIDKNGTDDTLTGIGVNANLNSLREYDSLDFSTFGDDIKNVSGDFTFPKELFDDWELLEINFGNLTYLENEDGESGKGIFEDCDLHTVIKIDYSTSTWASEGTTSSAAHTFDGADLSSLREIDMSEATFAVPGMSDGNDENTVIKTADSTFANAVLPSLTDLNFNGTVFASSGMSNEADIHTAYKTFYNTSMLNLTLLDLSTSVFAESEMTKLGYVYTASQTFDTAEMPNVDTAYLEKGNNEAIFGAVEMTIGGDVYSGYKTFAFADLSKIPEKGAKDSIVGQGRFEVEGEAMSIEGNEFIGEDKYETDTYWKTRFNIVFNPVPITETYFQIEPEEYDGETVQAIVGFSEYVVNTYNDSHGQINLLNEFDALDFTWHDENEPKYEYVSGYCEFDEYIVTNWNLRKIDFGSMIFLNDSSGQSGSIFDSNDITFDSLLLIDFNYSVWATKGTSQSADRVFYGASFENLLQIDMSHAVFAVEGMNNEHDFVATAFETFSEAYMPNLRKLNLKGAVFAVDGMTTGNKHVYSGMYTFYRAIMDKLETLDLSTTIFSGSSMIGEGQVYTAPGTFEDIKAPSLTKLILSKGKKHAVFASPNMNSTGKCIYTAYGTFGKANLSSIYETEIIGEGIYTGEGMNFNTGNVDENSIAKKDTFLHTTFKTVFNPLPISTDFYDMETVIYNGKEVDVLKGVRDMDQLYSAGIINYNAIDFTIATKPLYISGDFSFTQTKLSNWPVKKIDFGNAIFLPNADGASGQDIFKDSNLSNVVILNFNRSVWATPGTKYSAYNTFAGANLENLTDLNFSKAVFACEDMDSEIPVSTITGDAEPANIPFTDFTNEEPESKDIRTAYKTFAGANLSKLADLSLSGAVLSTSGMTKTESNGFEIHTASNTFEDATLSNLRELNLLQTIFASANMNKSGAIYTASNTFLNSNLQSCWNLWCMVGKRSTIFACANMSVSGDIHTGYYTFADASMNSMYPEDVGKNNVFELNVMTEEKMFNPGNMTQAANQEPAWIRENTYLNATFRQH